MQQQRSVPSPCVSICVLDEEDICTGCLRSGDEITRWGLMSDEQKREVYANIEKRAQDSGAWLTGGE